ncbi:hypothetical protein GCM10023165_41990 [Variovorax defluvii]|uniref:Uncharacterized protein n=1 Tax=Variovorax defluvii TaxID=913761 RepID=A0ABP8I6T8_9BURK
MFDRRALLLSCGSSLLATHHRGAAAATATGRDPRVIRVQRGTAPASLRPPGRHVLTFLGYSGAGYQNLAAMLAEAAAVLARHDPARTTVNIGATTDGIGAVYRLARSRGFPTMGIVSSQALNSGAAWAPEVERIDVIDDATWGGAGPDGMLSPTSAAMVAVSDEMVAIGGGAIARDELMAARREGKRCRFIPAESNHQIAREKASKAGKPVPASFDSVLGTRAWESP